MAIRPFPPAGSPGAPDDELDSIDRIDPRDLGARLREARAAAGRTQAQAAEAIGAARTTMVAIEKGERAIRPEELVRLARLYGRELSSLLRPGAPVAGYAEQLRTALPPESPEPGSAERAELLDAIHELERLCDDTVELERLAGVQVARRDPPGYSLEGADPEEVAEDVASTERNRLGLGDAPVLNLRAVLEGDVGLRVFYLDLPPRVAGMFAHTEEHGGALAIPRGHPPQRRRLSMAHEYGHFLTDRFRAEVTLLDRYERRPAVERFAERFARAFLMPTASVRRRFHTLIRLRMRPGERPGPGWATGADLVHLADYFYVSFESVTRRLEDLDLVPVGTWDRLVGQAVRIDELRHLLGRRERPVDDELLPARYRYLAAEAWQRGDLSEGQLAAFLRVDRLAARRMVRELGLDRGGETGEGARSIDLFAPLAAVAG